MHLSATFTSFKQSSDHKLMTVTLFRDRTVRLNAKQPDLEHKARRQRVCKEMRVLQSTTIAGVMMRRAFPDHVVCRVAVVGGGEGWESPWRVYVNF